MSGFYVDGTYRLRCPRCKHEVSRRRGYCRACGFSPASEAVSDSSSVGPALGTVCFAACIGLWIAGMLIALLALAATSPAAALIVFLCVALFAVLCTEVGRRAAFIAGLLALSLFLRPIRAAIDLAWYRALPEWAQPILWSLAALAVPLYFVWWPFAFLDWVAIFILFLEGLRLARRQAHVTSDRSATGPTMDEPEEGDKSTPGVHALADKQDDFPPRRARSSEKKIWRAGRAYHTAHCRYSLMSSGQIAVAAARRDR